MFPLLVTVLLSDTLVALHCLQCLGSHSAQFEREKGR